VPDNVWKGVRVKDLLGKVSIKPEARYALVRSWGGYDSDIDIDALMADDTILAFERNGSPIEAEHGYPLRLIIPSRYAYKSVKLVVEIELTAEDLPGYWEKRGYHKRADVWSEERFDR
jgi:DMSO/TMAO reductase YedYZ molybdopterin-dependent catalytic subunit